MTHKELKEVILKCDLSKLYQVQNVKFENVFADKLAEIIAEHISKEIKGFVND